MNWREYITVDPNVCHGNACIKNTHIAELLTKAGNKSLQGIFVLNLF